MARPIENTEAIEQAKVKLLHAAGLLQDILDGKLYQTDAADNLGISSMQHMLSEGFEPYIRNVMLEVENLGQELNKHMTAEEKILMHTLMPDDPYIFGRNNKLRILPHYDVDALNDAILDFLTENEAKILRMDCGCDPDCPGDHFTLDQMGDQINVTKERARQIRDRAYAKLRSPEVQARIFAPEFESTAVETEYLKSALQELKTEYRRSRDEYDELCIKLKALNVAKASNTPMDIPSDMFAKEMDAFASAADARIPDPELSYRSNHWLQEAGYLTLMDVYRAGSDKLSKIRGLGAKSVAELTCLFRDRYHMALPKAETKD